MRLPGNTTYEDWDAMRRERFAIVDEFGGRECDVTVQHGEYETALFFGNNGNSGIAEWRTWEGTCSIMTKRQAIFCIVEGIKNYMMNALDAWEFADGENIDMNTPWGVLFNPTPSTKES